MTDQHQNENSEKSRDSRASPRNAESDCYKGALARRFPQNIMLPKQTVDLVSGFVHVFDSERPATIEFRAAHNRVASSIVQRGGGWGSGAIVAVGKALTEFLDAKTQFVWEKLRQVVSSTEIPCYPELNADLKSLIESHLRPTMLAAESYIEDLRRSVNAPAGFTVETNWAFKNLILRVNAEVDLFCADYLMKEKKKGQSNVPTIIYQLSGNNSRVVIGSSDYSINITDSAKIFAELKKAIQSTIEDKALKQDLLTSTDQLEESVGKPDYAKKYADFVALAANHMSVLGPWIPALTQFLTS